MFDEKFIAIIRETVREVIREEMKANGTDAGHSEYLDEGEVAELLGYSKRSVRELRKTGEIPFAQFGRRVLFKREDLEAFISQHTIKKGRLLRRPSSRSNDNG